jgi:hypothetical protein
LILDIWRLGARFQRIPIIVATGAAILVHITGASLAKAIPFAGGPFAVSMGLSLTTLAAVGLV